MPSSKLMPWSDTMGTTKPVPRPSTTSARRVLRLNEPPVRLASAIATVRTLRRLLPTCILGSRRLEEDLFERQLLHARLQQPAAGRDRAALDALDLLQVVAHDLEALLAGVRA